MCPVSTKGSTLQNAHLLLCEEDFNRRLLDLKRAACVASEP